MKPFDLEQRSLIRTPLDDENILSGQFWGELRVFLAVAKAKSFNRAAELLNTSQPTVSRQVKRLQDLMGSQLFVPTKHGVKLTQKGEELAQALVRLDHSLFALTNDLKAETKETEGIVRLSVTDGLSTIFVAPAIPSFVADYPKIQLHLKIPANVISLRDNQTDMMIGFSPVEATDITSRALGQLQFIPVVSKSYIQKRGIPTLSNLHQHDFLHSELYTAKTGLWDGWNRIVKQGRAAHYCDKTITYFMLVKAGLGIGLLGTYIVLEPNIVPLDLGVKVPVPLYAQALTERLNARPVSLVFDWLSELFGPTNPWFRPGFQLSHPPNRFDVGVKLLFNL